MGEFASRTWKKLTAQYGDSERKIGYCAQSQIQRRANEHATQEKAQNKRYPGIGSRVASRPGEPDRNLLIGGSGQARQPDPQGYTPTPLPTGSLEDDQSRGSQCRSRLRLRVVRPRCYGVCRSRAQPHRVRDAPTQYHRATCPVYEIG